MTDILIPTFEQILSRLLAQIPDRYDKRPSSLIYNALAPAALELAALYEQLADIYVNTFADTAHGQYLERRAAEQGLTREAATCAIRRGIFTDTDGAPATLPPNSRFKTIDGDNSLIFTVTAGLDAGEYELTCETPGEQGNDYLGDLLPVTNINGLGTAQMTDIIVPGENTETDDSLYKRYLDRLNAKAYGGNIADYKQWTLSLDGVGAVKVYPIWAGGGTVKLVILDSTYNPPNADLLNRVQTAIDPEANHGEGVGLAPIGHTVTVTGAEAQPIAIQTTLTLAEDTTIGQLASALQTTLNTLFDTLRRSWAEQNNLTVRLAHIDAALLALDGVIDITGTTINGQTANITLDPDQVPTLGEVTINDQTI